MAQPRCSRIIRASIRAYGSSLGADPEDADRREVGGGGVGKTLTTYDPATEEPLAEVPAGEAEDIDRAVKAARKAFETGPWRRMTASERGRFIWKLADLIEKHAEEFAQLETLDNGKPLAVSRVADVPLVVDHFRYYAGWATKVEGETIPVSIPGQRMLTYTLASRSASSARSSRGTSRCSWRRGSSGWRSRAATPSS
jgi:acyl-CoA reductase-like NAD-dependent aldehyde dehydrogenase